MHRDGVHVLRLEFVARHIKYHEFGELLLDGDADSLREMGLAEARSAEDEERIERSLAGSHGYVPRRGDAHLVALPFHEVGEVVDGIEAGIDLDLVESGIDERSGVLSGIGRRDVHRPVGRRADELLGHLDGRLVAYYFNKVYEPGVGSDDTLQRHPYHIEIG